MKISNFRSWYPVGLQRKIKTNWKNLHILNFILYFPIFQGISHRPSSVAHLVWPLMSSCLQGLCFFIFPFEGSAALTYSTDNIVLVREVFPLRSFLANHSWTPFLIYFVTNNANSKNNTAVLTTLWIHKYEQPGVELRADNNCITLTFRNEGESEVAQLVDSTSFLPRKAASPPGC